jgi:hypothetical protein
VLNLNKKTQNYPLNSTPDQMPLNLLLSGAIDYELSHQLLLKHLLENPEFLKLISGIQETDYKVELEPKKGKFDMGIWNLKESRWSLMIELKMWSPLSAAQLQSQTEFLTENQIPGLLLLSKREFRSNSA